MDDAIVDGDIGGASTLQEAYDEGSSLVPSIELSSSVGGMTVNDASTPLGLSLFSVNSNDGLTSYFNVNANNVDLINTNISGRLSVQSTTEASIPCPVMSEANRDALTPVVGDCVYNSNALSTEFYNGSSWISSSLPTRLIVKADTLVGATSAVSFAFNFVNTINEIEDNFNALADTGDIVFTVPAGKDGYYDFDYGVRMDYSSNPSGSSFECGLDIVSATETDRVLINPTFSGIGYGKCVFLNLKLSAGDTVKFYIRKGGTASVTWNTDTRYKYLEISERI